jgi:hypothetical protein
MRDTLAVRAAGLWADYQCLAWWVGLWTFVWGLFLTLIRCGVIRWGVIRV